ncbi:MAG: DUF4920 domain-containing protein [Acidobacteria bacterium]|nr:DUF4920 domain-containing protein [Acidobacteriota bacterium]MBI3655470.1 DUF4920 domain-containing protein [Acidobacteriota bacterium]
MIKKSMSTIFFVLVVTLGLMGQAPNQASGKGSVYGKSLTLKTVTPLAEVIEKIEKYDGKEVLLEGTISNVCQETGCWLMLSNGKHSMRVTFENYGFFVPKDSSNKKVAVQGIVKRATLTEAKAKHYAAEDKNPTQKPEDIKGPQKVITMVATGVRIYAE